MAEFFVTEGSSYVGRHLIRKLVDRGHSVSALMAGSEKGVVARLGACPVADSKDLVQHLRGCSTLFHLSDQAYSWRRRREAAPEFAGRLAGQARRAGVERFVYLSTAWVDLLEKAGGRWLRGVLAARREAEEAVLRGGGDRLETLIVRAPIVWGGEDCPLSRYVKLLVWSGLLSWPHADNNAFSTCHVENLCEGLLLAGERGRGGTTYDLTDGEVVTASEMWTAVLAAQNLTPPARRPRRPYAVSQIMGALLTWLKIAPLHRDTVWAMNRGVIVDGQLACKELGYRSKVSRGNFILDTHDFDARPPVLVYQIGRVGSHSAYWPLRLLGLPSPVYHVHTLSDEGFRWAEKFHGQENLPETIKFSRRLRQRIDLSQNVRWRIVTMVRDPIAREISATFYSWANNLSNTSMPADPSEALQEVRRVLLQGWSLQFCLEWFDRELRSVFGVDVYNTPFDREAGYTLVDHEGIRILIMQTEKLDTVFARGVSQLLKREVKVRTGQINRSSERPYHTMYRWVLENLTLPEALVQKVYSSRYVSHFYGEDSIERFKRRWTEGAGEPSRTVG